MMVFGSPFPRKSSDWLFALDHQLWGMYVVVIETEGHLSHRSYGFHPASWPGPIVPEDSGIGCAPTCSRSAASLSAAT